MRRHLRMSPAEWRALPWHEKRLYREGLAAEFYQQVREQVEFDYVDPDHGPGPGTVEATPDNLAELGLTVRKAGG